MLIPYGQMANETVSPGKPVLIGQEVLQPLLVLSQNAITKAGQVFQLHR
jgi:hypothetical protein